MLKALKEAIRNVKYNCVCVQKCVQICSLCLRLYRECLFSPEQSSVCFDSLENLEHDMKVYQNGTSDI